jgi:phytoene synthase
MTSDLAESYRYCEELLQTDDRDRWLAGLFTPAEARPHLHALYAFSLEVARVREVVSEPMPGEIRFQWWRDALMNEARGDLQANPVAGALIDTIERFRLPKPALLDLIDARTFDLYDDPMPTVHALEGYCGETASALMRLAAIVLMRGGDPGGAEATGHAGVAYALTGLLRAFPWHAARGQVYVPADILGRHGLSPEMIISGSSTPQLLAALADLRGLARRHIDAAYGGLSRMAAPARIALLPLALCEPYLKRMEKRGYDPYESHIDLPQWRRQWALWRAAGKF